jgi:Right handed beta helix region
MPPPKFAAGLYLGAGTVVFNNNEVGNMAPGLGTPSFGVVLAEKTGSFTAQGNSIHDLGLDGGNPAESSNEPAGRSMLGIFTQGRAAKVLDNSFSRVHDTALHFIAKAPNSSAVMSGNRFNDTAIAIRNEIQDPGVGLTATITNNVSTGGGYDFNDGVIEALYSHPGKPVSLSVTITNNTISDAAYSIGIYAAKISDGVIAQNTLHNVAPTTHIPAAIFAIDVSNLTITGNTVDTTGATAIWWNGGANGKIAGNRIIGADSAFHGRFPGILVTAKAAGVPPVFTQPQIPAENVAVHDNISDGTPSIKLGLNPNDLSTGINLSGNSVSRVVNVLAAGAANVPRSGPGSRSILGF